MAVTVTYALVPGVPLEPPFLDNGADSASLAGGGVAVVGNYSATNSALATFQPDGTPGSSGITVRGTDSAVAQLSNGHMVVATDTGGEFSFAVFRSNGTAAVPATESGATYANVSGVDVTGLAGGGFVVVSQASFGGTDNDIHVSIRTNNGTLVDVFAADSTSADDRAPSVAALDDGGFAVAWHRRLPSGGEELWYAVYEADGTPRKAATMLDAGGNVNRNASVVALDGGGFAIAYEDTGWSGNTDIDITLARFAADGSFLGWNDVSLNDDNDFDPSVTVLSNGMIVVGSTLDNGMTATDPQWVLVDPASGQQLEVSGAGRSVSYEHTTSVAAMSNGALAAFFTDNDAGVVTGLVLQATRISTGDGADDVIIGDDLVDKIRGGGGADTLIGGLNGDALWGQGGTDTFEIHAGDLQGDFIDGGAGIDRLFVTADANARSSTLVSIEEIEFYSTTSSALTMTIAADQIGAGLAADLGVDGNLAAGPDTLRIIMGSDTEVSLAALRFQDFDTAGVENDRILIVGDGDAENIVGSSERDDVNSGGGDDSLIGRGGGDALAGGGGADLLAGGAGADTLTGGAGLDVFDFNAPIESLPTSAGRDLITDFLGNGTLAGDRIDLSTVDANGMVSGNQEFVFIGSAAFSGAGQVRYANGVLSLNTDGDLAAEMQVELTGKPALVAADLVL